MELKHTQRVLQEKVSQKKMESYAVLIGKDGQEALLTSPDVDRDTYFDIASVGKAAVTTQLVLQAIAEKKLALTDPLQKFFPAASGEKGDITVWHLLTHTSGIMRYPISPEVCARNNDVIAADILSHDLEFSPGTQYLYSCPGMMLIGFILEKIYRQTLDELYFTRIKHPLGIDRMRFNIAVDEENAAVCYERREAGLRRMDDWTIVLFRNGVSGSGGSFWSIDALQTLVKAILNKDERLYPEELFDLAEQKHFEHQGLGYELDLMKGNVDLGNLFPEGSFGHMGWTGCTFFINRKENLYAIILSNTRRCLMQNFDTGSFAENGDDLVYVHLRDVFNALKLDLDEVFIPAQPAYRLSTT